MGGSTSMFALGAPDGHPSAALTRSPLSCQPNPAPMRKPCPSWGLFLFVYLLAALLPTWLPAMQLEDQKHQDELPPLIHAIQNDQVEQAIALILKDDSCLAERHPSYRGTPLHTACYHHGRLELLGLLVGKGLDVNKPNKDKKTPLHDACMQDHVEVARFLLRCGAEPAAKDKWGETPLYVASCNGHLDIVRALVASCPELLFPQNNYGEYPIYGAIWGSAQWKYQQGDHLGVVQCFLEKASGLLHITNDHDQTLLHTACQFNAAAIAQELLQQGADPLAQDMGGNSPLHTACFYGSFEAVQCLVAADHNLTQLENQKQKKPIDSARIGLNQARKDIVKLERQKPGRKRDRKLKQAKTRQQSCQQIITYLKRLQ